MRRPSAIARAAGAEALLVAAAGCPFGGRTAEIEPIACRVGVHEVSFLPPVGWQHFDHGRQHAFERDHARIVIKDLGPRPGPEAGDADLAEWLEPDIRVLDPAAQRSVAARDELTRQDRTLYVIDTWDRLTHNFRRRLVVIPDRGSHLAIAMERGDWESTRAAVDGLVESLRFLDSEVDEPRP